MEPIEIINYQQQALDFLNATGTKMTFKFKTFGKHFIDDTSNRAIWRVRLSNSNGSYSFDFGNSIDAGMQEPTEYDILACVTKYEPELIERIKAQLKKGDKLFIGMGTASIDNSKGYQIAEKLALEISSTQYWNDTVQAGFSLSDITKD